MASWEDMLRRTTVSGARKNLTPYQGPDRVFGHFRCPKCRKSWTSGNSWANMGQECKLCRVNVYPYKQDPLKKNSEESDDNRVPHPSELCEMCKTLGRNCRRSSTNGIVRQNFEPRGVSSSGSYSVIRRDYEPVQNPQCKIL